MALEGRHGVVSKELFDILMMIKEYEYYRPVSAKIYKKIVVILVLISTL